MFVVIVLIIICRKGLQTAGSVYENRVFHKNIIKFIGRSCKWAIILKKRTSGWQ